MGMANTISWSGLNPGSTARTRMKELKRRLAPTPSTRASASCATTMTVRIRAPFCATVVPEASLIFIARFRLVNRNAGMIPTSTPTASDAIALIARIRESTATSPNRGNDDGPNLRNAPIPAYENRTPRAPPPAARITLSASNPRTSRPRPAPRACRTPNSPSRSMPRTRRRFAAFRPEIRSKSPEAPKKIRSVRRDVPTVSEWRVFTPAPKRLIPSGYTLPSGNSSARVSWIASISSRAAPMSIPGRSRPRTLSRRVPRPR